MSTEKTRSKNEVTIEHLSIACKHYEEMKAAGVTHNHSIRTLEFFCDVYAKMSVTKNKGPHNTKKVELWSKKARKYKKAIEDKNIKAGSVVVIEHGTPQRAFAGLVYDLWKKGKLGEAGLDQLVEKHYRLAVITREEDKLLNSKKLRSEFFQDPEERWKNAGIVF